MEASIEAKANVYHSAPIEVACESDEQLVIEKHGTRRDVHDMARMGKVQLLRVKLSIELRAIAQLSSAQLRLLLDLRVFHDFDEYVGGSNSVSKT